jgi:hypothetical protein
MTAPTRYPGSTWDPVSGQSGLTFKYRDRPKLVLHTTETKGLPDYPYPPHLTVDYHDGARKRWQHVELDRGAYALKGGSSCGSANYQTGLVYQVEHIAYAADVEDYPDDWYKGLAESVEWFHDELAVPLVFPSDWRHGDGWGTNAPQRMSCSEYRDFSGVCAHQHAPAPNDHWDAPFDIDRLMAFIGEDYPMATWKSADGYTYLDVEEWDPHQNGIEWTINTGLMVGDRSGGKSSAYFNARDPISRGEAATVFKRLADDAGITAEIED